ncbi:hypothetical protein, partial [Parafrankia sp. BMG5.11]|uniref:hypothetical protein n=1 Tax=Parafrankia sp. BMG5.11 TaxID=222540 RepID=UPI001404775E
NTTQKTQAQAVERILSALDGIKNMIASVPVADLTAARIPMQLHTLLVGLDGSETVTGGADVVDHLESASTEELFKFIDSEL